MVAPVKWFNGTKGCMESCSSMASTCTGPNKGICRLSSVVDWDSFTVIAVAQKQYYRTEETRTRGRHTCI